MATNQRGNRVESVEQKMRIDLTGERGQPGLVETKLLGLELLLVTRVVPDLERQHDGEDRAGTNGNYGREMRRTPYLRQGKHATLGSEQARDGRPQQLSKDNGEQTAQLKQHAKPIGSLPPSNRTEAEKRRESPDVFLLRRYVAQQSAQHADPGE